MKVYLALLGLSLLLIPSDAAHAGLIGDILNPLFPPRSTPGLEPSVLSCMAAAGFMGYPLVRSALKRWKRPKK